ncbi:MAG: immunoglobulin-like domain-containing protein [Clostridium sp.]
MKRVIKFISVLIMMLILVSCTKELDYSNLQKSKYENITNSEEISVTINQAEITRDTEEITLEYTNNTEIEYTYGIGPHLEVKHNETFYVVPVLMKVEWIEIACVLPKNHTNEETIPLKDYYGKLEKGNYRFIKEFYGNDSTALIESSFEIK